MEAEQLEAQILQRRAEIEQLETRARQAEAEASEIREEADRQIGDLERQKKEAQDQIASARSHLTEISAERDALNQATVELRSQREALTLSIASLEADSERLRQERNQIRLEKAKTEERLQSALSQVADTRESARGIILNLPDILFDVDKATLKSDLKTSIAKLAGILLIMSELQVRIEGHTDSTGSPEHNLKLSTERSRSVLTFLEAEGIAEGRMKAVGYGLSRPIADNGTREGRQKNRRVEIIISASEIGEG